MQEVYRARIGFERELDKHVSNYLQQQGFEKDPEMTRIKEESAGILKNEREAQVSAYKNSGNSISVIYSNDLPLTGILDPGYESGLKVSVYPTQENEEPAHSLLERSRRLITHFRREYEADILDGLSRHGENLQNHYL